MRNKHILLLACFAVVLIAGCAKETTDVLSVEKKFRAVWLIDDTLPGGGLIVGRGEGSNGVITVELPTPEAGASGTVALGCGSITHMNITVKTPTGTKTFGDADICTAAYIITFEHTWPDGSTHTYNVSNLPPLE